MAHGRPRGPGAEAAVGAAVAAVARRADRPVRRHVLDQPRAVGESSVIFADPPSSSVSKRLLKKRGGAQQNGSLADGWTSPAEVSAIRSGRRRGAARAVCAPLRQLRWLRAAACRTSRGEMYWIECAAPSGPRPPGPPRPAGPRADDLGPIGAPVASRCAGGLVVMPAGPHARRRGGTCCMPAAPQAAGAGQGRRRQAGGWAGRVTRRTSSTRQPSPTRPAGPGPRPARTACGCVPSPPRRRSWPRRSDRPSSRASAAPGSPRAAAALPASQHWAGYAAATIVTAAGSSAIDVDSHLPAVHLR